MQTKLDTIINVSDRDIRTQEGSGARNFVEQEGGRTSIQFYGHYVEVLDQEHPCFEAQRNEVGNLVERFLRRSAFIAFEQSEAIEHTLKLQDLLLEDYPQVLQLGTPEELLSFIANNNIVKHHDYRAVSDTRTILEKKVALLTSMLARVAQHQLTLDVDQAQVDGDHSKLMELDGFLKNITSRKDKSGTLILGLPGSGKSYIADELRSKGYPVIFEGAYLANGNNPKHYTANYNTNASTADELNFTFTLSNGKGPYKLSELFPNLEELISEQDFSDLQEGNIPPFISLTIWTIDNILKESMLGMQFLAEMEMAEISPIAVGHVFSSTMLILARAGFGSIPQNILDLIQLQPWQPKNIYELNPGEKKRAEYLQGERSGKRSSALEVDETMKVFYTQLRQAGITQKVNAKFLKKRIARDKDATRNLKRYPSLVLAGVKVIRQSHRESYMRKDTYATMLASTFSKLTMLDQQAVGRLLDSPKSSKYFVFLFSKVYQDILSNVRTCIRENDAFGEINFKSDYKWNNLPTQKEMVDLLELVDQINTSGHYVQNPRMQSLGIGAIPTMKQMIATGIYARVLERIPLEVSREQ